MSGLTGDIIVTTSWDDNSCENLRMIKLLDRFGIHGTFYVNSNTDDIGRSLKIKRMRQMVLEVTNSQHEIGSHSANHVVLTKSKDPEDEVERSKNELENLTHNEVLSFCYPYGVYDDRIKSLVKKAGYLCGRTCRFFGTDKPKDPYQWGISLHASNKSPLESFKTWLRSRVSPMSLLDWEIRAKLLFDSVLRKGGIWHLWGHSWEIDIHKDWAKLTRVLQYISNREGVDYLTNSEIFKKR